MRTFLQISLFPQPSPPLYFCIRNDPGNFLLVCLALLFNAAWVWAANPANITLLNAHTPEILKAWATEDVAA